MEQPREESQILEDLATLAASPGYVHAVAHICHRDNVMHIKGKLKPSDMERLFSRERLIRTELTTLIGLMAKKPLDLSPQRLEVVEGASSALIPLCESCTKRCPTRCSRPCSRR